MNPNSKTPQNLDPKLKEAYDRVMGGNFMHADTSPVTPAAPKTNPPAAQTINPAMPMPNSVPPSTPLTNSIPTAPSAPPLTAMSPTSLPEQNIKNQSKLKFSPILFLVIGGVFFIIYAVVWAKIFKLF